MARNIKPFWKSRTFWVTAVAAVAAVVQAAVGEEIFDAKIQLVIVSLLALVLRFRTHEGIGA